MMIVGIKLEKAAQDFVVTIITIGKVIKMVTAIQDYLAVGITTMIKSINLKYSPRESKELKMQDWIPMIMNFRRKAE